MRHEKVLAIVPARAGSKRLKNKNILDFFGSPLIKHTVDAAIQSKFVDEIIISTDDNSILNMDFGSKVTLLRRPDSLGTDFATSVDVIEHALNSMHRKFGFFVLLQPTSPLRTSTHIDNAIEYFFKMNASSVISVSEVEHSPLWSNTLPDSNQMNGFIKKEYTNKRGQDLPIFYRINGAIYICSIDRFLKEKTLLFDEGSFGFKMEKIASIDIDDEIDFELAKVLFLKHNIAT